MLNWTNNCKITPRNNVHFLYNEKIPYYIIISLKMRKPLNAILRLFRYIVRLFRKSVVCFMVSPACMYYAVQFTHSITI